MELRKCHLSALFVLLSICVIIRGHPQCLDSRPPFAAESILSFCPEYSDYGCCTGSDDVVLQARYKNIQNRIPASRYQLWADCSERVRTLLCQRCSPYAAHIFDSETMNYNEVLKPRAFPGLCLGYCTDLYNVCQDVIQYYMMEFEATHPVEMNNRLYHVSLGVNNFCSNVNVSDMDYCYPELLTNPILTGNIQVQKESNEGCLCMERFTGVPLSNPIFFKHANDSSDRVFIGEQKGLVHIFYPDGSKHPYPFIDISSKVDTSSRKGDERGMLGMEFHPDFAINGLFYIYYSTYLGSRDPTLPPSRPQHHRSRVEEFRVSPYDPNMADPSYSRVILDIVEPYWNHNGGEILFGDDRLLYLFVGDGGMFGDPLNAGQNLEDLLGKVLRIDVDNVDYNRGKNYSIPADNPFIGLPKVHPEIYAYGVRNIWRCGKDRGDSTGYGKGRIICGDVGQSTREELNLLQKGANYGWNLMEGTFTYCNTGQCNQDRATRNLTGPIHDYPHSVGKSITGGHFYRGCLSPNLDGFYIYGDFMSGALFRLKEDPVTKQWENKQLNMCGSDMCTPPLINNYTTSIISFGEDRYGEVYMLSTSFASTEVPYGNVYRIVDPSRRGNPATCPSAQMYTPTTPIPVTTTTADITTKTTTPPPPPTTTTIKVPTTIKDTSGAKIPTISGPRLNNYLDYYKRLQLRNQRRRLQQKFREERDHSNRNLVTYKFTPPPRNPGKLTMLGIDVQRCTSRPRIWCSLNRFVP